MLLSNTFSELIAPSGITTRAECTLRRFAQLVICGERHFSRYSLISSRTTNIDSITHGGKQQTSASNKKIVIDEKKCQQVALSKFTVTLSNLNVATKSL